MDELLSPGLRRPGPPIQIRLRGGSGHIAVVHTPETKSSTTLHPVTHLEYQSVDALSCLDTGDLRWRSAADKARRVLDKPIPVLIQGESGVGKEYFARAMHDTSARRTGPFVAINCSAIPENLIEAELFGYAPGAFTGAKREGSPGRLREANGGTLFLDEIGDMPLSMQTRLLRVLQERCVSPLGGGGSVEVDFALVCATRCNLREEADLGRFRSDLYYRINGLTIALPPLRERTDFQALTQRLLAGLSAEREVHLAEDLLKEMEKHAWPGNLRQLASVLRTSNAMLAVHEDTIEWCHLPDEIVEDLLAPVPPVIEAAPENIARNLDDLEKTAIQQVLVLTKGNVSQAARILGVSRQTLYRKMAQDPTLTNER